MKSTSKSEQDSINIDTSDDVSMINTDDSVDIKPDVDKFVCDICAQQGIRKVFDSEMGLRMHKLRAHRISPRKSGEETPPTPPKQRREAKGVKEELEKVETKIEQEFESLEREIEKIPDPYQSLYFDLRSCGLDKKKAYLVVNYMKNYSPDDIHQLFKALTNVGMARGTMQLFLESWIRKRRIRVDPALLEELGLTPEPDYYNYNYSYSYGHRHYRRPRYEGEPEPVGNPVVAEAIRSTTKITEKLLEKQLAPPPSNNDQTISLLQQQIQQLQLQNEKLREELRRQELRSLKQEIERLREEMKYQRGVVSQFDLTARLLDNLHETVREGIDFLKKLARVPRPMEEAPQYEEAKEASEIPEGLIPEEFIEEE